MAMWNGDEKPKFIYTWECCLLGLMDKICLIEGCSSTLGPPEPRNGAWI